MNPAWRDIRVNSTRYGITIVGLMFIQLAAVGMIGFYRGIVRDMLVIVDGIGADFWVVQGDRIGPFAEVSVLPGPLDRRVESVPGVQLARRFIQFPRMIRINDSLMRVGVTGLDYPKDRGHWIPLVAGRAIMAGHHEVIADQLTGLAVGDRVHLGQDDFRVVGISKNQVDLTFDPAIFVTITDALAIGVTTPSEEVLLTRAGRRPGQNYQVSAILVSVSDAGGAMSVQSQISRWPDISIVATEHQKSWIVNEVLGPLRQQILYFVCLLLAVTGTILGLTMHGAVLQKVHFIALIKMLGASDLYIVRFILTQAFAIGIGSFAIALTISWFLFPRFPRSVLVYTSDMIWFFLSLLCVCVLASGSGIRKALQVRAREALG